MINSLKKNDKVGQYEIIDVLAKGGNSMIYIAKHHDIGLLILKEHIYGLCDNDSLYRDHQGRIMSNDESWYERNRIHAKIEIDNLKLLREQGFVYYEASLSSFIENNTIYTPILNTAGKTLDTYSITSVEDLYHYTLIVLKAIQQLHERNLIHLDISPDNILITPYDVGFLIDFSCLQLVDDEKKLVNSLKEEYSAIEVLEHVYYPMNYYYKHGPICFASDIYSIGKVMLYLEKKLDNKNEYKKELDFYHEVGKKASRVKASDRYQSIEEIYLLLSERFEHLNYQRWKTREFIISRGQSLYNHPVNNKFYYKNRINKFVGRKKEEESILNFQNLDCQFAYMSVTAPAGAGKSSLLYHYIQQHSLSKWRYLWLNGKELNSLDPMDISYLGFDLMIIVDYVSGYYKEIAEFLDKAIHTAGNYKLRVVFLERGHEKNDYPRWMEQLKLYSHCFDEIIDHKYYYQDLYLETLGVHELKSIIGDENNHIEEAFQEFIKVDSLQRPLFALMVAEMMNDINDLDFNQEVILNYMISKQQKRIYEICQEEQVNYDEWCMYYVKATIVGCLDFEDIEINIDDYCLKRILDKINNTKLSEYKLYGLEPDILGEYLILEYLKKARKVTVKNIMNEAWQMNSHMTQRTLLNMERDFGKEYRELLNFDVLYAPYMINREYHDLLKELSYSQSLVQGANDLLKQYFEYYIIDHELLEYNGDSSTLVIPEGVITIGRLSGNLNIEKVYISDSVEEIKEKAFYYNRFLMSVSCGKSLRIIGKQAFAYCYGLEEVQFNEGLVWIDDEAFYRAGLNDIIFPESLECIGHRAFFEGLDCEKLIIGENVFYIGEEAFSYCDIHTLDIQSSLPVICKGCFAYSDVYTVSFSEGLEKIEDKAFLSNSISSLELPLTLQYIGKSVFADNLHLENIILNEGLVEIDDEAFYTTKLHKIAFPSTLKYIGHKAFKNNYQLEDIIFNDGLLKMGNEAFMETHITSLSLPKTLEYIGERCFESSIYSKKLIIPGIQIINKKAFYKAQIEYLKIEEGVKEIKENAFSYSTLKEVILPETMEIIGYDAFENCLELKDVYLNQGLKEIHVGAFHHCAIENINRPSQCKVTAFSFDENVNMNHSYDYSIKDWFDYMFKDVDDDYYAYDGKIFSYADYTYEETLILPADTKLIRCIHDDLLDDDQLYNPRYVLFNEGLEKIGDFALNQSKIEEIIIPSTVKEIGEFAFLQCRQLKKVELPKGLKRIRKAAFRQCTALEQFILPETIEFFESDVIAETGIKSLIFPSTIKKIGDIEYTYLETLMIPENARLSLQCRISHNPHLKSIVMHENNFDEFPFIHFNDQLKYVEIILNDEIEDYEKKNSLCEKYHYPITLTEKSCIIEMKDDLDIKEIYTAFIRNEFIFTLK